MNLLEQFKPIKTFIFDIDGVLAIDTMIVMPDGELIRSMNSKDGYALQLAIKKGYHIVIITGGNSKAVEQRLVSWSKRSLYTRAQQTGKAETICSRTKPVFR